MTDATETDKPAGDKTDPADAPGFDELTAEQYEQQLEAAREEGRKQAAEQSKAELDKEKRERDDATAREQGKFRELADKAAAERDQTRLELARERAQNTLLRHLADKHPAYVTAAKWILPAVEVDATTTAETLNKRVEQAAADYVRDNPRGDKPDKGSAGAPAGGGGGARQAAKGKTGENAGGANNGGPQFTGAAARF